MAWERELELARRLAEEAGSIADEYQTRGVSAELKPDESPVTVADRAIEKLIVNEIASQFPEDGVLGEEGANRESKNGRKWIIDPIDGTKDFVRGIPLWSVLIGLEQDGEVVAGTAYCPGQNLIAWATKGGGSWVNDTRVHVSDRSEPNRSVLCFNGFHKAGVGDLGARLLPWVSKFWAVRGLGGAVDAILVAQGKVDVWIEPNAAPWDFIALKIIVEEAGGKFASFRGENTIYGGNGYACAPGLEPYVQALLKG